MNNFIGFRKILAKDLRKYTTKKLTLQKGEILFLDQFPQEKIVLLTEGMINFNNSIQVGKELSLGCYSAGAILFLGSIFKECIPNPLETASYNISASCECNLEFISIDTFTNIICNDSELMYRLYQFSSLFHEKNFYQLRDLQIFNTEDAILAMLLRAYNTYGAIIDGDATINRKIFNTNLAKCLDVTEETVSRTIGSLRKENILSKKNNFLVINDLDYVKERLGCKYCNERLCYL